MDIDKEGYNEMGVLVVITADVLLYDKEVYNEMGVLVIITADVLLYDKEVYNEMGILVVITADVLLYSNSTPSNLLYFTKKGFISMFGIKCYFSIFGRIFEF